MHENIRGAAQTRNKHFHANLTKYFQPINLFLLLLLLLSFFSFRRFILIGSCRTTNEIETQTWNSTEKKKRKKKNLEEEKVKSAQSVDPEQHPELIVSNHRCYPREYAIGPRQLGLFGASNYSELLPVASMNICRFRFRTKSSFPPPNYNAFPHRVCIINSSSRCFPRRSGGEGRIKIYFEWGKVLGVGGGAIRFRSYRFDLIVFFSIGDGILIIERNDGISAYSKR